jgi:hypothetical protein
MKLLCRHCRKTHPSRPRGLCWTCYYATGVRALYQSTSKFGHRGVGNFYGRAPLPEFPTMALPGSEEKVQVLEERARRRQALFHPDDATTVYPVCRTALAG